MARPRRLIIAGVVIGSFLMLVAGVVVLVNQEVVTPQLGLLMLVALVGLYVGFGILIAVYRLIGKLD